MVFEQRRGDESLFAVVRNAYPSAFFFTVSKPKHVDFKALSVLCLGNERKMLDKSIITADTAVAKVGEGKCFVCTIKYFVTGSVLLDRCPRRHSSVT